QDFCDLADAHDRHDPVAGNANAAEKTTRPIEEQLMHCRVYESHGPQHQNERHCQQLHCFKPGKFGHARLCWVCGSARLKTARVSEATPATINVHVVACCNASPVNPEPKAVPSQFTNPSGFAALTFCQSTKMNVNGHAANIQPMVPPMRTMPNSFCASFM